MKTPSKAQLETARAKYHQGARVELPNGTDDDYSPIPAGMQGTVVGVDDMLNLMVEWDNGFTLNAIIGHDCIRKKETKSERIKNEAKVVALTGRTNMFDRKAVFEIAVELGCDALANFIFERTKEYGAFILTGELPADIEDEIEKDNAVVDGQV